ncbi:JAB domain-containing protein [Novosphingobium colocasiae]|uniref:MPN domain-containing protein n=1 Tax=Novosphingobium colocasiae TaxID=1256513 RepID=A0A918UHG1_9SPHN|nr:JAB domain-containing protein [Novosphingobium colocasiae]GGZ09055.1 hypothetical protein GCM10011614_24990 [Novosphingobium colocasiae]
MARILGPVLGPAAEAEAERLIGHFGTLARLHAASTQAIVEASSDGEAVAEALDAARSFTVAAARERLVGQAVDPDSAQFRDYLISTIGMRAEEVVHMVYSDERGLFLGDDLTNSGCAASSMIPLRLLVRRALDLNARRVVLAHNHPSGLATPSKADIAATSRANAVLRALEVRLVDHLIVAGGQVCSMRALRLL